MVDRKIVLYAYHDISNTNCVHRMILIIVWWFVSARKWFHGPVLNVEHQMLGRTDGVVIGLEKNVTASSSYSESEQSSLKVIST